MHFHLRLIPAVAAACLLVSCGGGGGTDPGAFPNPDNTSSAGVAVDGYLRGSTVLCDSNGNGMADSGEQTVGTSRTGRFVFEPACTAGLVAYGGSSVDTGLAFVGAIRTPAGGTVISPLTTLVASGLTQAQVLAAFDLPAGTDLLTVDPAKTTGGALDNPALMRSTLVAQQLLQKVAETLAGLAGESDATAIRAMYTAVADAFAATLVSGDPLANNGELDEDVIAGIVADAADRAQALYTFTSPVNSETLGIVMAGALAIQAETILTASEGDLATVTAEAQTNGQIESFIVTNVGLLNVEPGTAAAALSTLLLAQLNPYLALVDDEIRLVNGSSETAYTFEEFQSTAGVSLAWPLPEPMMMEFSISDPAAYTPVSGQVISAAVSITETGGGQGKLLAYIDNVAIQRTSGGLRIVVPTNASAIVYGVSSDGAKKAVVDFGDGVVGVSNTLLTTAGSTNSIAVGEVINYAINQLSNDFSDIYGLRGTYDMTVTLNGVELRHADGSLLPAVSVTVPTELTETGGVADSRTVAGRGLVGHLKLTD